MVQHRISLVVNKVLESERQFVQNLIPQRWLHFTIMLRLLHSVQEWSDLEMAKMIVDSFFETEFEGGRHQNRLDIISEQKEKVLKVKTWNSRLVQFLETAKQKKKKMDRYRKTYPFGEEQKSWEQGRLNETFSQ